mmetsp:Transcript_14324/g.20848  ORF Transcript_14324/g.20848 Transcript_14324/m.20848 type:complete len:224 (-) Transcript_14324:156-827(-)
MCSGSSSMTLLSSTSSRRPLSQISLGTYSSDRYVQSSTMRRVTSLNLARLKARIETLSSSVLPPRSAISSFACIASLSLIASSLTALYATTRLKYTRIPRPINRMRVLHTIRPLPLPIAPSEMQEFSALSSSMLAVSWEWEEGEAPRISCHVDVACEGNTAPSSTRMIASRATVLGPMHQLCAPLLRLKNILQIPPRFVSSKTGRPLSQWWVLRYIPIAAGWW